MLAIPMSMHTVTRATIRTMGTRTLLATVIGVIRTAAIMAIAATVMVEVATVMVTVAVAMATVTVEAAMVMPAAVVM